jgi:hypothetical protein
LNLVLANTPPGSLSVWTIYERAARARADDRNYR